MRTALLRSVGLAATALLLLGIHPAQAQSYPPSGSNVSIIVPYPPGGGTDTAARMMAAALEKKLHATFTVVNRAGAASQVGLTELVRAKPDGLTLAYAVLPTVMTTYLDPKRQAIFTAKSFAPIATHYISAMMLAVQTDSPYKSLKDLVEAARKAPGAIKISDSGLLGTPHTTGLFLAQVAGVRFTAVHFPGGAPSITALLGGHVQVLAGGISDGLPYLRSGQFRILGVAADAPDPAMADVPTMKAQGYDVVNGAIGGLVAPAGTPQPIIDTLASAMKDILQDPEQIKRLRDFGSQPYYHGPAEFAQIWASTEARLRPLMASLNAKP